MTEEKLQRAADRAARRDEPGAQSGAQREKLRGLAEIETYLETLREARPSVAMAADRSAKGGQTILTILKAAREVFVREGHAGLSMRMVAEEAGVALGNVSYYFPSKRALLEAMLREELADYVEEHIRQFESARDSPLEILLNVVEFYVANARGSHRFFFQMWGYAGADDSARALVRELYRPIGRFILSMVRAANPSLSETRARQIVLQIFALEEGVKLFIGMGPETDAALKTAERDLREATRRLVEAG
jgi:AcrR family transcriptional regulator